MSARHDDPDDSEDLELNDDYSPRQHTPDRSSRFPAAVIVAAVVGVVVLGCGGGAVALFWARTSHQQRAMQAERVAAAAASREAERRAAMGPEVRVYRRSEFRELVLGKTEAEVREAVGLPMSVTARGGETVFVYQLRTVDPGTGAVDRTTRVVFKDGKAETIDP